MANRWSEMGRDVKLTVTMTVTPAQAVALFSFFEYWNRLSRAGSSAWVAFYVDGDGDFHPDITVTADPDISELLTDDLKAKAVFEEKGGNGGDRYYDYDAVAMTLRLRNL